MTPIVGFPYGGGTILFTPFILVFFFDFLDDVVKCNRYFGGIDGTLPSIIR